MKSKTGKNRQAYKMDYIDDKDLFKAVMFACSMIKKGTSPSIANYRAAAYYGCDVSDVAHYVGQRAGRTNAARFK